MSTQQVVATLGIKRDKGFLYFLRGSEVWKTPMMRQGKPMHAGGAQKVATGNFKRETGYLYFLDKGGNVARSKMKNFVSK
jgi:hypothetical protein